MKTVVALPVGTARRRGRLEGVWQILRFNYPMFVGAGLLAGIGVMVAAAKVPLPAALLRRGGFFAAIGAGAVWAALTLLVAHYVYDCARVFEFGWLPGWLRRARRWANIHAGFDQTTVPLREVLPCGSGGIAVDLFDPQVMTERSIGRARESMAAVAGTVRGRFYALPLADEGVEMVLLLFAAHECRRRDQRAALFCEAARALEPGGAIVLVEHMRGMANFLAFGPGVFHFFSREEWSRAGRAAALELVEEFSLTPFATCLIWRKSV